MKCCICGTKFGLLDMADAFFYLEFEADLKKFNAYDNKKYIGSSDYCPKCQSKYHQLKSEKNVWTAYKYFKDIILQNNVHRNIDVNGFDRLIESLYSSAEKAKKQKEDNEKVVLNTKALINKKRRELENEYGYSWIFPKSREHHHVCAKKYKDNFVMLENQNPQFNFTEKIEDSYLIHNKVNCSSADTLFMVSVIPLENIVSYQLIGNIEHTSVTFGGGGGGGQPNLKGAAIGGLLFGGAGAIIGSQTGIFINPIQSEVIEYDSRRTILNLKNAEGQVEIRELPYYYSEVFMKVIPEKEFNFLQANKNTEAPVQSQPAPALNMVEEMKQLKELLDLNLITQEEFDAKRQQILKL